MLFNIAILFKFIGGENTIFLALIKTLVLKNSWQAYFTSTL